MTRMKITKAVRATRREAAEKRQAEHDALSLQDKIDKATSRRGESKREQARYALDAPDNWVNTKTGKTKGSEKNVHA